MLAWVLKWVHPLGYSGGLQATYGIPGRPCFIFTGGLNTPNVSYSRRSPYTQSPLSTSVFRNAQRGTPTYDKPPTTSSLQSMLLQFLISTPPPRLTFPLAENDVQILARVLSALPSRPFLPSSLSRPPFMSNIHISITSKLHPTDCHFNFNFNKPGNESQ